MESKKSNLKLMIISTFALLLVGVGVTWAFFSYVYVGNANVFETGDIYFKADYTEVVLTNVFPVRKSKIETDTQNVMTVNVNVEGYTTYEQGVDYVISARDVSLTTNGKSVPISASVTSENIPNIYINSYEDESILEEDSVFAYGSILPSDGEVNGVVTIKAYIDKNNVVISDTYDGTESDNMGTTNEFVDDRIVFTTEEWNNLESNGGVSFRVKVKAWEHEEPDTLLADVILEKHADYLFDMNEGVDDEVEIPLLYISGTKEQIVENYVQYSGILWRVVGIDKEDNSLVLMSEQSVGVKPFDSTGNADYETSEIREWLNNEFANKLNKSLIKEREWSHTKTGVDGIVSVTNFVNLPSMVDVFGIVKDFETEGNAMNSYIFNNLDWWTAYTDGTSVGATYYLYSGALDDALAVTENSNIRPMVNLKSDVFAIAGDGTYENPYILSGEFEKNYGTLYDEVVKSQYLKLQNEYGVRVLSGTNEMVNNNYVSYSGLLWRIVGLDDKGNVKLVTEDIIAERPVDSDDNSGYYNENELRTWLNKDFLNTIYGGLISDSRWNYSAIFPNEQYVLSLYNGEVIEKVGLLTYNEYAIGVLDFDYKTNEFTYPDNSFLKKDNPWWLLSHFYSRSMNFMGQSSGVTFNDNSNAKGVRPSICIKYNVNIKDGDGTVNSPYTLIGDITLTD